MRAGAVDALAAAIGQRGDEGGAEQVAEPAGEVAAHDVAVAGRHRPARDQRERDDRGRPLEAPARLADGILVVQQAEIVLAALADDDAAPPRRGIGMQTRRDLALDLPLQVTREGRDPDRAAVPLGPQARRREIAERLARAGAGLGQHQDRVTPPFARREGRGRRVGVVGLAGTRLGARAEQVGEAGAGEFRRHRMRGRRRPRCRLLPRRQAPPDRERVAAPRRRACPGERRQHRTRPRPSGGCQQGRERGRLRAGRCRRAPRQRVEQRVRDQRQRRRLGFGVGRHRETEREREPARRRRRRDGRPHEREQFEQVERRETRETEPPRDQRQMHDQRRRRAPKRGPRRVGGEMQELAILGQQHRPRVPRDKSGHGGRTIGHLPEHGGGGRRGQSAG